MPMKSGITGVLNGPVALMTMRGEWVAYIVARSAVAENAKVADHSSGANRFALKFILWCIDKCADSFSGLGTGPVGKQWKDMLLVYADQ